MAKMIDATRLMGKFNGQAEVKVLQEIHFSVLFQTLRGFSVPAYFLKYATTFLRK